MLTLETYRKQAKLLVRWHRDGNYSIGERIRILPRYSTFTDRDALAHRFTLAEAQEIIAREAGFGSWSALKSVCRPAPTEPRPEAPLRLESAIPVLFVADVTKSAAFYRDKLGFTVEFLHGHPPFYGSVARDNARLHLKWVHQPVFGPGRVHEEGLIMAFLPTENVKALYAKLSGAGVEFNQKLTRQPWGGTDFHVRDPDDNILAFVG